MAGISFDFRQQGNPEETRRLIKSLRQQTQAAGLYFPDTPVDLQTAITLAKPFLEKQAEQSNQQLLQQKQGDIASGQARGLTEVALPGLQGALEKFHSPEVVNRAMGSIQSSGGPSGTGAFSPLGPEAGQLTLARALAASKTPISEPGYTAALTQKPDKDVNKFAPQMSNKYIPVGEDKFQLTSVDDVAGTTRPILKDGKPIILTEKQVLIAEGKKTESLIDPFETKFMGKLGESEGVRLTELKKTALDAVNSKEILSEGLVLLNSGIYAGSAANVRLGFNKWLQEAGIKVGNSRAANTEAYAGLMGLQVGKIIKAFGSGTGLSDADREYAQKIAGGQITLSEASIRKLIDINMRLADFSIREYNRQAGEAKQAMEDKDFFRPIDTDGTQSGAPATAEDFLKKYR